MAVAMEGIEEGTDAIVEAKKLHSPKKSKKRKGGGKENRAVDILFEGKIFLMKLTSAMN